MPHLLGQLRLPHCTWRQRVPVVQQIMEVLQHARKVRFSRTGCALAENIVPDHTFDQHTIDQMTIELLQLMIFGIRSHVL